MKLTVTIIIVNSSVLEPVMMPTIDLSNISISGAIIEKKIKGIAVLILVAAVASAIWTFCFVKKCICAIPPPVANGVTFDMKRLIKVNRKIYTNGTFTSIAFKIKYNLNVSIKKYIGAIAKS
jgi:hypothetical protein